MPIKKISLTRHSAKCAICNHPDREEIEYDFLHCTAPTTSSATTTSRKPRPVPSRPTPPASTKNANKTSASPPLTSSITPNP